MKVINILLLFLFASSALTAQCYNLVWEDEFNGTTLDNNKWSYQTGGGGWGNNESQYYTNGNNINVSNGSLKITAEEDNANVYPNNDYTSSRIRSIDQGDWTYGKMEARIKLPQGQGIWPAFWMMPSENTYGTWPSSGEIDIMEYLGHQTDKIHGTCHYGANPGFKGSSGNSYTLSNGQFPNTFHTFGIEWEPNEIRWYLDGILYHTFQSSNSDFSNFGWTYPFNHDFHFILNVAVGGNWPGYPDATTVFPQTMEVDWVRVYQQLSDINLTGETKVTPGATGITYTLPDIAGAAYNWTVPQNALITAGGLNSNQLTINWGYTGGTISASMTTNCGTQNYSLPIDVSANLWENYNFEQINDHWNLNQHNNATANFDFSSPDVFEGSTSLCITPTNLVSNVWDLQLGRSNVNLVAGEEYIVSFWAKSNAMGQDVNLAFIDANNYSLFDGTTIPITTTWTQYSFTFVAPATATALFNIDLGDENGTFCFDDFYFSTTENYIPIALDAQVLLEGAYNSNGQMNKGLQSVIPLSQPYNLAPYNYNGTESLNSIPNNMVDWVLLEIRLGTPNVSGSRGTVTVASRAGLLLDNGNIVDLDGTAPLLFNNLLEDENYHICIRHRNHLDILSANSITATTNVAYDFSNGINQAFGINQLKTTSDGYAVMYAGDYNPEGIIQTTDYDAWVLNPAVLDIYSPIDGNLDGTIQTTDYDLWFQNKAKIGSVEINY